MSSVAMPRTGSTPSVRLIGVAGLVGTVLLFASVIASAPGEPPLDASTADAAEFIAGLDVWWVAVAAAVADIAMVVLLWFMVGLALLLRRDEGEIPVRSTVAMLSGVIFAAYVILEPSQEAAAHRVADLDQGQLAYAYDVSTIGFTNVWLAMGSFAFASGWLMVSTKALPRWLGWWGVVAGLALGLAQLVWTPSPGSSSGAHRGRLGPHRSDSGDSQPLVRRSRHPTQWPGRQPRPATPRRNRSIVRGRHRR
jgi:hypothetical protein